MPQHAPQPDLPATLREIIEHKRLEVQAIHADAPLSELRSRINDCPPPRGFFEALTATTQGTRVIAEIKRRSPSAGLIRPEYDSDGFNPALIAQRYSQAGASAISCLTDEKFFGGSLSFIQQIKAQTPLPVLRKDFIIDPIQIYQARIADADAILLIAECLSDEQIRSMLSLCNVLGLGTLLEVHSRQNLLRVLPILDEGHNDQTLLGINNRDLTRMITDLAHTTDLLDLVPDTSRLVSESGIKTAADLALLRDHGVQSVLVGEHLMRQSDPGQALADLLSNNPDPSTKQ